MSADPRRCEECGADISGRVRVGRAAKRAVEENAKALGLNSSVYLSALIFRDTEKLQAGGVNTHAHAGRTAAPPA